MKKEERGAKLMYDSAADIYHTERLNKNSEGQFYNAMIEMPGMFAALGNVRGKKILDWGCGSGIYLKKLEKMGAKVKGFDISKEMIEIAKKDNPRADLRVGSGLKIPFNEKFDIVFASLALHYLDNWDKALKEVGRVLKDKGIFIFSIIHPLKRMTSGHTENGIEYRLLGKKDYFKEGRLEYKWILPNNKTVIIPQYHKTFSTIVKTLVRNGFEIIDYDDLRPLPKAKKLFPQKYEVFSKIPNFCIWRVRKN